MKRMHVHVSVKDLAVSIDFYRNLFGAEPTVIKDDYAKWMLDDPRVNFAISTRADSTGVNHLGIQTDSDEELTDIEARVASAGLSVREESNAQCCYARSDKHWLTDPQGVVWEAFHTLDDIPTYGGQRSSGTACCAPAMTQDMVSKSDKAASSCGGGIRCC